MSVADALLRIARSRTSELTPSWYDTAQVVRASLRRPGAFPGPAPALALRRLVTAQLPDGSWGYSRAPARYRVVPTLAGAAALLEAGAGPGADAALAFLTGLPGGLDPATLPDTIAVELIVPALLETLRDQLPPGHFAAGAIGAAAGHDAAALRKLRAAADAGVALPPATHHSLEVLARPPARYRHADYLDDGCLACSPAATAAALTWDGDKPCPEGTAYLSAEGLRLGGAWPTVAPIRTFEAAWLAGTAARFGVMVPAEVASRIGPWLAAQLGADGCAAGPALAADSDDTAIVLFALHGLGHPWSPRTLFRYETETHFATFPGERTVSCSTNAHVLEVLLAARAGGHRCEEVDRGIAKAAGYLLGTQHPDGHWDDKWHASPFYATACAVLALRGLDQRDLGQPGPATAVARAVGWVLDSQRADGSWGLWSGTREETAHALHVLHGAGRRGAVASGAGFLRGAAAEEAPLWHGKELYEPRRIVDALVAITLAEPG